LEIEGLPDLKVEQAFEFADASAERSANGCTVKLNKEPIIEYIKSNISLIQNLIDNNYEDKRTLLRRMKAMEDWLKNPTLLEADKDSEYASIIEINLDDVKVTENVKKVIRDEFQTCLKLLDFNKFAYEIYRRWYVDGRLYYHVIIDSENSRDGIKEVRYVTHVKFVK